MRSHFPLWSCGDNPTTISSVSSLDPTSRNGVPLLRRSDVPVTSETPFGPEGGVGSSLLYGEGEELYNHSVHRITIYSRDPESGSESLVF